MDKGTKIYSAVLAVIILALIALFLYEDPQVSELNERLEADRQIATFPYRFRVLEVKNSLAMMSTPRSTEVPVERVLGLLFPAVARRPSDSPEFREAQQRLAKVQTRARDLVLDDAQIRRVSWVLDLDWLRDHGILLTP